MKATKKIVGAACALVAAVALSAGTTFAWFAMNNSVTATGMSVSAKSDSVFLVINQGSSFDANGSATNVTSAASAKSLLPVAHGDTAGTVTSISDAADMTDYSKWWYGYSNSLGSSTIDSNTATRVTEGQLDKYLASETFYVGLKSGSDVTSLNKNLVVSSVTLPADTGVVLVLVCGNNVYEYKSNVSSVTNNVLANPVTTTGSTITAYYYIDGQNTNVYTNNIAQLTGTVSFSLTLADVS